MLNVKVVTSMSKKVSDAVRRHEEGWKPFWERVLDSVLPLPGPVELGRSEDSALPMRDMGLNDDDDTSYCWEDWEAEVKRDYPIAWWVRRVAPRPFRRLASRADDALYWIKCHTLPSYKFTTLDLRNPGGGDKWDYGWRDRSQVMLWANFKILVDFVETEEPGDMEAFCAGMTDEEVRAHYGDQLDKYREVMSLYRWWKTERAQEWEAVQALLRALPSGRGALKSKGFEAWRKAKDDYEEKDQTQLLRLIAIREYLWT